MESINGFAAYPSTITDPKRETQICGCLETKRHRTHTNVPYQTKLSRSRLGDDIILRKLFHAPQNHMRDRAIHQQIKKKKQQDHTISKIRISTTIVGLTKHTHTHLQELVEHQKCVSLLEYGRASY